MERKFSHVDLLLIALTCVWGVNFTVIKFSLREMTPLAFNALRFVIAGVCLVLFLRFKEGDFRIERKDILPLIGIGVVGNTVYQLLFILGVHYSRASNSSLILASSPIFITLLSAFFRHEKVRGIAWAGIVLSFTGVALIITESAKGSLLLGTRTLKGDLMLLLSCICWSVYSVFCVHYLRKYSALRLSTYTTVTGYTLFFLLASRQVFNLSWGQISGTAWAGVLFSGVFAIGLGHVVWYYGVQRIGNIRTAVYSNLIPLVALVVARVFLSERITLYQGLGGAVVILGLYLTRTRTDVPPSVSGEV